MKPLFAFILAQLAKLTWKQYLYLLFFATAVLLLVFGKIEVDAFFKLITLGTLGCILPSGPFFILMLCFTLACNSKKPTIEQQAREQVETKLEKKS